MSKGARVEGRMEREGWKEEERGQGRREGDEWRGEKLYERRERRRRYGEERRKRVRRKHPMNEVCMLADISVLWSSVLLGCLQVEAGSRPFGFAVFV